MRTKVKTSSNNTTTWILDVQQCDQCHEKSFTYSQDMLSIKSPINSFYIMVVDQSKLNDEILWPRRGKIIADENN